MRGRCRTAEEELIGKVKALGQQKGVVCELEPLPAPDEPRHQEIAHACEELLAPRISHRVALLKQAGSALQARGATGFAVPGNLPSRRLAALLQSTTARLRHFGILALWPCAV